MSMNLRGTQFLANVVTTFKAAHVVNICAKPVIIMFKVFIYSNNNLWQH